MNNVTILACDANYYVRHALLILARRYFYPETEVTVCCPDSPDMLMQSYTQDVWIWCTDSLFSPQGSDWLSAIAGMSNNGVKVTLVCLSHRIPAARLDYIAHLLGCFVITLSREHWENTLHKPYFSRKTNQPLRLSRVACKEYRVLSMLLAGINGVHLSRLLNITEGTLSAVKCRALKKMHISHINELYYLHDIALKSVHDSNMI